MLNLDGITNAGLAYLFLLTEKKVVTQQDIDNIKKQAKSIV